LSSKALHGAFQHLVRALEEAAARPAPPRKTVDVVAADAGEHEANCQRRKADPRPVLLQEAVEAGLQRFRGNPAWHKTRQQADEEDRQPGQAETAPHALFFLDLGQVSVNFHRSIIS
jgi:hypothetical protein